jgi:hypothetical protein
MSEAKSELCVSLRTDSINSAVDDLRDALAVWHQHHWNRRPARVLVSFEQAQALQRMPADHTNASAWDKLGHYCAGLGVELVAPLVDPAPVSIAQREATTIADQALRQHGFCLYVSPCECGGVRTWDHKTYKLGPVR